MSRVDSDNSLTIFKQLATTHLLLKHTLLPEWLPSLLTNILPKLSASLIVLDISFVQSMDSSPNHC